ncbi:MAG: TfoX/Sxy family protein [Candidatus Thorarchaeota archaeon]
MATKSEDDLRELIKQNLVDVEFIEKKMFGKFAFFIEGNMFTGVHQSYLFLRLSSDDRDAALSKDSITVFEPRKGMVLREYVVLLDNILDNKSKLKDLFRKSVSYVSSLPPKYSKNKTSQ